MALADDFNVVFADLSNHSDHFDGEAVKALSRIYAEAKEQTERNHKLSENIGKLSATVASMKESQAKIDKATELLERAERVLQAIVAHGGRCAPGGEQYGNLEDTEITLNQISRFFIKD